MSLITNNISILEQKNNNYPNKNQIEQSEIKEKQINYAINLFILHGIFQSFELRTKYL
jgi:hypothetical protein